MFRVALFSIVLTFAVAPQATMLCKLWCAPSSAATGCDHHDPASSAGVRADDACGITTLVVSSFIREDGPRAASASNAAHAVIVPRYWLAPPSSELLAAGDSERWKPLERRPLETTLRL